MKRGRCFCRMGWHWSLWLQPTGQLLQLRHVQGCDSRRTLSPQRFYSL